MHRKGIVVMGKLIGLVKPLIHIMVLATLFGVAGNLCAVSITALGGHAVIAIMGKEPGGDFSLGMVFIVLCACSLLRGIMRYGEQVCNHYIAFKILALIRHRVFSALRKLAPAKLEGRDKGNLVSIITGDIELLEVFYAHTISPVAIAFITSVLLCFYLGSYHPGYGLIAGSGYLLVGAGFPLLLYRAGRGLGLVCRNALGEMNSYLLDSLRGLTEILQYHQGENRRQALRQKTEELEKKQLKLKRLEGITKVINDGAVYFFSLTILITGIVLYRQGKVDFEGVLIPLLVMMGSFGPVIALSGLSNNLIHTLASGNRVLDLLEESPAVTEITGQETVEFDGGVCEGISFDYGGEEVLNNISLSFAKNEIIGICGRSGCGKSTLLKLLLRFFDVREGRIVISERDIRRINTVNLWEMESYVTQETHLFHASIAENIGIAKEGATREEIEAAAQKASLHEFIMSLSGGYDTDAGELGERLSGGERQRIGVARAFLRNGTFLLLDEPTSNLDSLNEGIILKAIMEEKNNKTILLVSHRASTLNIADTVYELD